MHFAASMNQVHSELNKTGNNLRNYRFGIDLNYVVVGRTTSWNTTATISQNLATFRLFISWKLSAQLNLFDLGDSVWKPMKLTQNSSTKCNEVIEIYNAIVDMIYIFLVVCFFYAALLSVTFSPVLIQLMYCYGHYSLMVRSSSVGSCCGY